MRWFFILMIGLVVMGCLEVTEPTTSIQVDNNPPLETNSDSNTNSKFTNPDPILEKRLGEIETIGTNVLEMLPLGIVQFNLQLEMGLNPDMPFNKVTNYLAAISNIRDSLKRVARRQVSSGVVQVEEVNARQAVFIGDNLDSFIPYSKLNHFLINRRGSVESSQLILEGDWIKGKTSDNALVLSNYLQYYPEGYQLSSLRFKRGGAHFSHYSKLKISNPSNEYPSIPEALQNGIEGRIQIGNYQPWRSFWDGVGVGRIALISGSVYEDVPINDDQITNIPVFFDSVANHLTLNFHTEDHIDFDYNDSYVTIVIHGLRGGYRYNLAGLDLRGSNLSGLNLNGADLSYANLNYANLSYANLSNVNLQSANLLGANLVNADLRGANLTNVSLPSSANLSNVHLSREGYLYFRNSGSALAGLIPNLSFADLSSTDLMDARLWFANLSNANFSNVNLSRSVLWAADLGNANLVGADLREAGLVGANLSNANVKGADLRGADLRSTLLTGADLAGADFRDTDLRTTIDLRLAVNLRLANLSGVNLSEFDLSGINLNNVNLSNANLSYVNLSNANLLDASLVNADLRGANLTNVSLPSSANLSNVHLSREGYLYLRNLGYDGFAPNLENIDLSNANLSNVNLTNANLVDANLQNANLVDANLREANLSEANLREANLSEADLREANLTNADLLRVNLQNVRLGGNDLLYLYSVGKGFVDFAFDLRSADLSNAYLRDVNFSNADLQNADLRSVNLVNANLEGTDLRGADLRGANIGGAWLNNDTTVSTSTRFGNTTVSEDTYNLLLSKGVSASYLHNEDAVPSSVDSPPREIDPVEGETSTLPRSTVNISYSGLSSYPRIGDIFNFTVTGQNLEGRLIKITLGYSSYGNDANLLYLRGHGSSSIVVPSSGIHSLTATVLYDNVSDNEFLPFANWTNVEVNIRASTTRVYVNHSFSLSVYYNANYNRVKWFERVNDGAFVSLGEYDINSPLYRNHNTAGYYAYCAAIAGTGVSSPILTVIVGDESSVLEPVLGGEPEAPTIDRYLISEGIRSNGQFGNHAYIDAGGNMPGLSFYIQSNPANITVNWDLQIRYNQTRTATINGRTYTTTPNDASTFTSSSSGEGRWTVPWGSTRIGGNAVLTATAGGQEIGRSTFKIRGMNPSRQSVKNWINGNISDLTDRKIFKGITRGETTGGRSQFNGVSSRQYAAEPNWGYPNGWGITQLDPPGEAGNANEVRQRRWNWKENIAEGLSRYHDKYTDFACKWQTILEANYSHANGGASIPYPTVNQVQKAIGLTNYNYMDNDVNTLVKIYHIQAYNGVTTNHSIRNITGRILTDCRGNTIMLDQRIYTCWDYQPDMNNTLKFHPNSQNYIQKINNVYRRAQ